MRNPVRQIAKRLLEFLLPRHLFIVRGNRTRPVAALTFDDGPHPEYTEQILDILRDNGVPATFFVLGRRVAAHRDILHRIVAEGHQLGHHSYTHGQPGATSAADIARELDDTATSLSESGLTPPRLFRPPHGKLTPGKLWVAWRKGLTVTLWSADPKDFQAASPGEVLSRLDESPLRNGDIVLLHDTAAATVGALPEIIRRGSHDGLRFVRLSELTGAKQPPAGRTSRSLPPIVFFGNDWHAENRTSSHQIARRLAARTSVIYFECPGLRSPSGSASDRRKLLSKLAQFFRGAVDSDGLVVVTLLQLPIHGVAAIRWLNAWLLWISVRYVMWRRRIRRPISWFMIPHVASLAGTLRESHVVYYCIDDYAALPGVDRDAVARFDAALTKRANVVFVASDTLLPAKRALNPRTVLSPHGVDFDHFAAAADSATRIPGDLARLPRPIVGFFGLIEDWIDLDLVDYLARERPSWTFLMIGKVAVAATPMRRNVHFIGYRPYDDLPAYGRCFDAAIIPYRLTRQVMHSNPTKLREYLAMGKPVVAVSTPEIDKFGDVVAIARTRDEFLNKLDAAVSERHPDRVAARMKRAAAVSWDARVDRALTILRKRQVA